MIMILIYLTGTGAVRRIRVTGVIQCDDLGITDAIRERCTRIQ